MSGLNEGIIWLGLGSFEVELRKTGDRIAPSKHNWFLLRMAPGHPRKWLGIHRGHPIFQGHLRVQVDVLPFEGVEPPALSEKTQSASKRPWRTLTVASPDLGGLRAQPLDPVAFP